MTAETLGQNCWFNFSRLNEERPPATRDFAEQKAILLNPEAYNHLMLPLLRALPRRHQAAHPKSRSA